MPSRGWTLSHELDVEPSCTASAVVARRQVVQPCAAEVSVIVVGYGGSLGLAVLLHRRRDDAGCTSLSLPNRQRCRAAW